MLQYNSFFLPHSLMIKTGCKLFATFKKSTPFSHVFSSRLPRKDVTQELQWCNNYYYFLKVRIAVMRIYFLPAMHSGSKGVTVTEFFCGTLHIMFRSYLVTILPPFHPNDSVFVATVVRGSERRIGVVVFFFGNS